MSTVASNPGQAQVAAGNSGMASSTPPKQQLLFAQASYLMSKPESDANYSGVAMGNSISFNLEANGFLADLKLFIVASGGVGTTTPAVAAPDAPFNVIQSITVSSPGGTKPIVVLSGYQLYLANLLGGYGYKDPASRPSYSAVNAGGNFAFQLTVPIQISERSGLGALANMNSSSLFTVTVNFAPSTSVYTTAPSPTVPTLGVSASSRNWVKPAPKNELTGVAQEQYPPFGGMGPSGGELVSQATQYWTNQVTAQFAAGDYPYISTRVGNLIRNIILVTRESGARADNLPSNFRITINNTDFQTWTPASIADANYEQYGFVMPAGVYVIPRTTDLTAGAPGEELRSQWIPTLTNTKLKFEGVYNAAGTLEVITNDVAVPAGANYLTRTIL